MERVITVSLPWDLNMVCPYCEMPKHVLKRSFVYTQQAGIHGGWKVKENYYHCIRCDARWQPQALKNGAFERFVENETEKFFLGS